MARLAHSTEHVDLIEHLMAAIARLSSEVKDASTYLPTYDQRTYTEAVKALREKLEETRAIFAPRPKFTFKNPRKNPSAVSLNDAAELAAQKRQQLPGYLSPGASSMESSLATTPKTLHTPPNEGFPSSETQAVPPVPPPTAAEQGRPFADISQLSGTRDPAELRETGTQIQKPELSATGTTISISNQSEAHLILPSSSSHASTPCALTRLERCVVDLSVPTSSGAPFASLTMKEVRRSLLLCGSISGPAHVTGVEASVLVINCRQLRMHDCRDVDVYLKCTSRPIIEDCKGIRFTELPKTYQNMDGTDSAESQSTNMWDQVDDFKWLKAEHSPNWSILPPEDTVVDDAWREIVPGGPGWSLQDILTATKVVRE